MERAEAEAIYEQGREAVVAVLLELSSQNALLRRQVAELSGRLAKQEERIAELERRLKRNSRNSSLPPSLDPPVAPERRPAAPSGRGRGATVLRQQAALQLSEQQRLGAGWINSGRVFTKQDGAQLHPERISASFRRLVAEAALPRIPLHGLRHTYAGPPSHLVGLIRPIEVPHSAGGEDERNEGEVPTA